MTKIEAITQIWATLESTHGAELARELLLHTCSPAELDAARPVGDAAQLVDEYVAMAEADTTGLGEKRRESIAQAVALGAKRETLRMIATAARVSRGSTIHLPTGRYYSTSRGKSWCRKGKGDEAKWAEVVPGKGHCVTEPGRWSVGSDDGFRRRETPTIWDVEQIKVGEQTWTVAN